MNENHFNDTSISHEKKRARHPGRVFAGIAVTALEPGHKEAYKESCYAHVAKGIRHGLVKGDDEIVLVGLLRNMEVLHAFIARRGEPYIDSVAEGGASSVLFHADEGRYIAEKEGQNAVEYELIACMPFDEFKVRYNALTLNISDENAGYSVKNDFGSNDPDSDYPGF